MSPQGFDHHFLQVLELVGVAPRFFMVLVLRGRWVPVHAEHRLGHGQFCSKDRRVESDALKLWPAQHSLHIFHLYHCEQGKSLSTDILTSGHIKPNRPLLL